MEQEMLGQVLALTDPLFSLPKNEVMESAKEVRRED
jgi:hypothetical protein